MVKKEIIDKVKKFRVLLEKNGISVSKMLLYGSHARGTAHKDRDIDVCVISSSFGKNRFKERIFLFHQAPKVDPRIEPVAFSLKDFQYNKLLPLLYQIRKEAREIK